MSHARQWLMQIVAKDPRYKLGAYEFLFESLEFTRCRLGKQRGSKVRHVTARELLEGIRILALENFGRMAKTVLNEWGVHSTADIGEMVFNLVESGDIEKNEQDTRADFNDVYDFSDAFCRDFKIQLDEF